MSRKTPFPIRERLICERLRDVRIFVGQTRIAFAKKAGMDASLLYSYERARSQLNYGAAYKILTAFPVNPQWLATGEGSPTLPVPIPNPNELGVGARALFSKTYDKHVAPLVADWIKEWKSRPPPDPIPIHVIATDPRSRLAAEAQIVNWIKRLILCLPDERLQTFLNFIYLDGTKLYRAWPADTKEAFQKRLAAMDDARAQMEEQKAIAGASEPSAKNQPQSMLDKSPAMNQTADVQAKEKQIVSLPELLKAVRELVKARGMKTALAREMEVSRQAVDQWLSEDAKPSADLTFKLLTWVKKERERQPK